VTAWIVVRRSNVCRPRPAAVAIGEPLVDHLQQPLPRADRLADDELARVFERAPDLLAARHLADAGAAGAVGDDQQVAREERAVRAAQVEQHAVAAGDRNDAQLGDRGRGERGHGELACPSSFDCPVRNHYSVERTELYHLAILLKTRQRLPARELLP
jgi:hypothetical protein